MTLHDRQTRSTTDLSSFKIDQLQHEKPPKVDKDRSMRDLPNSNIPPITETKVLEQKFDVVDNGDIGYIHNDQIMSINTSHCDFIKQKLQTFSKFDGSGDAETWFKILLEKFDSLQVDFDDRLMFVQKLLTGEAFIWYAKNETQMSTFLSFSTLFLRRFSSMVTEEKQIMVNDRMSVQQQAIPGNTTHNDVFDALRNQLLLTHIEKVPKFSARSKQNVSKWLRDVNQTMHLLKLSEEEKLFFIPSCLEQDAKDWFLDNTKVLSSWSVFTQKLTAVFETPGKADIAFNRLRKYQQGFNQDVRQYFFEIIKLCKEANPEMDEATKLQYLKDGLKPSLRFDILLYNPTTIDSFFEYAQKIEVLKLLDERNNTVEFLTNDSPNKEMPSQPPDQQQNYGNSVQVQNRKPKPPYRCYRCNGTDHFINQCPHFQQ